VLNPFVPLPASDIAALTEQALQIRLANKYARFPVQLCFRLLGRDVASSGEEGLDCLDFQAAEGIYRAGAQGLPVSQIPQLPQSLVQISRLSVIDQAGRTNLRRWVEGIGRIFDESEFIARWNSQGQIGGAEHQVYYDEDSGRWFKRLYGCLNGTTLGDYFDRMVLHAVLFPETAYRLEGFTINSKSKLISPVLSQVHVCPATYEPPVTREETTVLMADMGFIPVQLRYDGVIDDGYFAYYRQETGVLVHDLHDENVVRMQETGELAVIDPFITLARTGTWAALKIAEVGFSHPSDG